MKNNQLVIVSLILIDTIAALFLKFSESTDKNWAIYILYIGAVTGAALSYMAMSASNTSKKK